MTSAARSLRLAFFGTPDFAVPTLEELLAGPHPVVSVVSQPDRPRGRGRKLSPSPVAECGLDAGIPVLRPERVGEPEVARALAEQRPDLGIVVAFGQFIPKRIRELPTLGYCINGHASLLPRWRGAAPIARCILAGDEQTGVSVMRVEREMDAGAVAAQQRLAIEADENAGDLGRRLSELTARLLADAVAAIAANTVTWTPQDPTGITTAPKLERGEAKIDWSEAASAVARRVRAFAPSPGASTSLDGEMLRILAARGLPGPVDVGPGTVRCDDAGGLRIACGEDWLEPTRLQRAGGRVLDVADFLRGKPIPDGARLV